MNDPSHLENNYFWRVSADALSDELAERIYEAARRYGRLNWQSQYVQKRFQERR